MKSYDVFIVFVCEILTSKFTTTLKIYLTIKMTQSGEIQFLYKVNFGFRKILK